jgi:hypothetical protein
MASLNTQCCNQKGTWKKEKNCLQKGQWISWWMWTAQSPCLNITFFFLWMTFYFLVILIVSRITAFVFSNGRIVLIDTFWISGYLFVIKPWSNQMVLYHLCEILLLIYMLSIHVKVLFAKAKKKKNSKRKVHLFGDILHSQKNFLFGFSTWWNYCETETKCHWHQ